MQSYPHDDELIVDAVNLSSTGKWRLALGLLTVGAVVVTVMVSQMSAAADPLRVISKSDSHRVSAGPLAPPTTRLQALPAPLPKPTTTTTTTTTAPAPAPARRPTVAPTPTAPTAPTPAAIEAEAEPLSHPPDSTPTAGKDDEKDDKAKKKDKRDKDDDEDRDDEDRDDDDDDEDRDDDDDRDDDEDRDDD